ncbi:MAG: LamG domain-containing protein, partial [Proteobacteria bacterium]|nr:LamG domain-containing protein [Pseudomonadota bacterium]
MRNANSVLLTIVASFVLAACGGGAQTTDLPPPNGGGNNNSGNAPYTGPTARDADVLKFQQEFWSKTRTTDRCGNCHNESVGQNPMFVRSDDVNMAYDAALTVVDSSQPAASRIVEKVS